MVTIAANRLRDAAAKVTRRTSKSATAILKEDRASGSDRFDVFLSHSRIDKELVLGARQLIIDAGLTVYVDWVDDGEVERGAVDRERASMLRKRMAQCDALFYAHTPNSSLSRWCPWELGYFDALNAPEERVFVMAIVEEGEVFHGQEYLGLYQTVDPRSYAPDFERLKLRDALEVRLLEDLLGLRTTGVRDR